MSELDKVEDVDVRPVENTDAIEAEDSTEEVVEESATSDDASEPEKPKKRSRAEERINALTREKYEAQKQAEAFQRQVVEMQQYLSQQQANVGENMPTLADFGYDEAAYSRAIQAWSQQQIQRFQESQQNMYRQQQQVAQAQQEQARIAQKMSEGAAKYPDFVAKVANPQLPSLRDVNPAAFQALMESDSAVDVAYYLASNPEQVYAFASMDPVKAIKAVAKLESQVTAKPLKASNPLPKPPSKLAGNSEAAKDPSKMTTAEWMEWRNSQVKRK